MKTLYLILGLSLLAAAGCEHMLNAYRNSNCTYDEAFAAGVNAAKNKQDMNPSFAKLCDAALQEGAARGYREGYTTGLSSQPIEIKIGAQRECHSKYGREVCGYSCLESYGTWTCASKPSDNCVESYGTVKCGTNCRVSYGQIKCD